MRYDYFLIWGNGVRYRDSILDMIRSEPDLKIVKILYHTPETIDELVDTVYSYDYAPLQHLKGKTEYLRKTVCEVYFVFVENHSPCEDYFGDGPYRHIESRGLKELKEKIRDTFNPRENGKRTEEHVIHASDNQMQTDYILRYLRLNGIDLFTNKHLSLDAPYHVQKVSSFSIRKIPMFSLRCNIVVGDAIVHVPKRTTVESTPHYRALSGEHHVYDEYVRTYLGMALTDDHCLENLLRLSRDFRYLSPPYDGNYIITRELDDGTFSIIDGVHRAAILKHRGVDEVIVAVIDQDLSC
ncbi:hypothetical protein ANAEL_05623 [Anaerolineales bacterium]|nr:hypothetical protein ANAEL_05623 [Anaerolineales bacterium]